MNMMNNMNMNNMQNNFNLMNGFWQGGWFAWDKRPIEALMNAAGVQIDKLTLYNHICKKIHEIDWQLQQKATCNNEKQYIAYINKYNQALRFLSLYFADIIEKFDPIHYSYYFKNYNSMYRFLPQYIDPINGSQQNGKVTFYNTVAECYQEIPLAQLDNTNDLPEICDNVGATCYANACRNMILSNKMLRVVLSRIGGDLLGLHQTVNNIVTNAMNQPGVPTGSLCNKVKGVGGCTNPSPDTNQACTCKLSVHAKKLVEYARQHKWGVLEMLCLYARCADLASQITNRNDRSKFLAKIFAATMVIIGDKDSLFRVAGASDTNDLSNSLNGFLAESLSHHTERNMPIALINPTDSVIANVNPYVNYNIVRTRTDNKTIPGQLALKVSKTAYPCGYNAFATQIDNSVQLNTCSYTSPGIQTTEGTIYDLQSALSLENQPTMFQGENVLKCNGCGLMSNAVANAQYVYGNLLSQLKPHYGKGNSERKRVVFNEYVVNWNVPKTRSPEVYQLKCFIMHTGGNDAGGHYVSYHKVHTGGTPPYQWYRLDDGILTLANNNTVQGILQNPSFSNGCVAMRLYYERVPSFQMMHDLYGNPSVTYLTAIPSHEDLKLSDPLYMSFFNKGNNNYGEPNPNNPYTAVLGLQQLLTKLGLGNLINNQMIQNAENLYKNWNVQSGCANYNNNLYPAQQMNNMFMNNNFMFPQMSPSNNVNLNMGNWKGNNNQQVFFK